MEQSNLSISILWRRKKLCLDISSGATLKQFGEELQKLTCVKADTMRLIVPQSSSKNSKLLSPFSDEHSRLTLLETSIVEGKSIRMMGVSEDEVHEVLQNANANFRIAGFDEEEKRLKQRREDRPRVSLKLPQGAYIFCDFRTLEIPGIQLNPPASEALKRMHMLAADPGIVAIMNKHRWRVGIMTELAPVGYVGVSPKCILGYNKNHGEEISLRLRTDDLKGFRKYESIKKTLLHELAHMIFSEHDANFYALDKELNEEAAILDWTKSRSHTLGEVKHSVHDAEELYFEEPSNTSYKLGGKSSDHLASARASSVMAAYRRSVNAPSGLKEPDPDDTGFNPHEDSCLIESPNCSRLIPCLEPDPDDCSGNQIVMKHLNSNIPERVETESGPGVDASAVTSELGMVDVELAQWVPSVTLCARISEEPDPDDSLKYDQPGLDCGQPTRTSDISIQTIKTIEEPDPDDSEARLSNSGHQVVMRNAGGDSPLSEAIEDLTKLSRCPVQPDPVDLLAHGVMHEEPDPDDTLVHHSGVPISDENEPDPDDTELRRIQDPVTVVCNRLQNAIGMLQSEVSPAERATILQTLFKIIRNLIEHPEETKFKRLRMANPVFQKNVASYKAAMEVLSLIGFIEDVVLDEIGKVETYMVLKRNDPGLLWLAKSSLETRMEH